MAAQTTTISAPSRLEKHCFEFPAFFHLTNIDVTSCFYRQFFRLLYEDKGQKWQFLNSNISEMLASIELKLNSMFIRFMSNVFH